MKAEAYINRHDSRYYAPTFNIEFSIPGGITEEQWIAVQKAVAKRLTDGGKLVVKADAYTEVVIHFNRGIE